MRIGPNGGRYFLRREWLDEYERSCEVAPIANKSSGEQMERPITSQRQSASAKLPKARNRVLSSDGTLSFQEQLNALKVRVKKRGAG